MPPVRRRACPEIQTNERERKPERLRTRRRNVGICTPAPVRERGCRGRSPHRLVPGLPTRCASHACGGGSVRFLAHGSTDGICTPAPVRERGCRGRSPHRLVPGLPTRCASHACGGGSVRFLAHGSTASACIATGTPCAPPCRRKWQGTSAAVHITVV